PLRRGRGGGPGPGGPGPAGQLSRLVAQVRRRPARLVPVLRGTGRGGVADQALRGAVHPWTAPDGRLRAGGDQAGGARRDTRGGRAPPGPAAGSAGSTHEAGRSPAVGGRG